MAKDVSAINLKRLENDIDQSDHQKAIRSFVDQYSKWVRNNCSLEPFPLQKESLCKFLVSKVNQLGGSTKSLRKWMGFLRSHVRDNRLDWLDEADDKRVYDIIKRLEFLDIEPTQRAEPMTSEIIGTLLNCGEIEDQLKCLITVGHDSVTRGGELCSGLKVKDLIWDKKKSECRISLDRTKTHRSGGTIQIIIIDFGPTSGVYHLRRFLDRHDLWNKPESFIFPYYNKRNGINWENFLSVDQFRRRIKQAVQLIGLNPSHFGTHSLRAGGTTAS